MLTKLPLEIIIAMLSHLSRRDLLQCSLLCSYIHPSAQAALCRSIRLTEANAESILQYFGNNREMGKYVQHAEFGYTFKSTSMKLVPAIFTNLRSLEVHPHSKYFTSLQEFRCYATLRELHITDSITSRLSAMLQSNPYAALIFLRVDIRASPSKFSAERYETGQMLIEGFRSTPALQHLVLENAHLTYDQWHQLHKNLPCLESLETRFYYEPPRSVEDDDDKTTMQPPVANRLKSFQLEFDPIDDIGRNDESLVLLRNFIMQQLNYVCQNYSKLTRLILLSTPRFGDVCFVRGVPLDLERVQQLLRELVFALESLDVLQTELLPYSQENVSVCEKHRLKSISVWDLYIDLETQMTYLSNSALVNSIRSMYLHLCMRGGHRDRDLFKRIFSNQTWVNISRLDIDMTDYMEQGFEYALPCHLLQYLPNLESLSVRSIQLTDAYQYIPTLDQTQLKSLSIGYIIVGNGIQAADSFSNSILSACPSLEYFKLCVTFYRTNYQDYLVLDLSEHDECLKMFDLEFLSSRYKPLRFSTTITGNSEHPSTNWTLRARGRNASEQHLLMQVCWNPPTKAKINQIYPYN